MSKVTHINSGDYYALDCGHVLNDFDVEGALKKDAEVDCPMCADNEERVKAARMAGMKAAKDVALQAYSVNGAAQHIENLIIMAEKP